MDSLDPPPPYCKNDFAEAPRHNNLQQRIARKPLKSQPSRTTLADKNDGKHIPIIKHTEYPDGQLQPFKHNDVPELPPRPELIVDTAVAIRRPGTSHSPAFLDTGIGSASTEYTSTSRTSSFRSVSPTPSNRESPQSSPSTYVQKAYREARHFAGGLITHPYESTKHYTILRHSHGLVFYQGNDTTLAVSIFADQQLPRDRTIWLQSKGWSGKTGMRLKAFVGSNTSWLNVTPTTCVTAEQLKPNDERAWQRDIAHFRKKAKVHSQKNHSLRETAIVRIPAEATDGYFQLILCLGEKKKILCSSPTFRVISASANPSSLRGASLSTLPIELGAIALGTYARHTAGRVAGPVITVVQNRVAKYMPSFWVQQAATAAYGMTGISNKVDSSIDGANLQYEQARDGSFTRASEIKLQGGPTTPYPISFVVKSEPFSDIVEQYGIPSISLKGLPYDVEHRLLGHYFGWARFVRESQPATSDGGDDWYQAIISSTPIEASQMAKATIAEANRRTVTARLICDFDHGAEDRFYVEIRIMGFIRPDEPLQRAALRKGLLARDGDASEAAIMAEANDVSLTISILNETQWAPEFGSRGEERHTRLGKLKSSYADLRMAAQRQIDQVQLSKIGVRMPVDPAKGNIISVNGFYVLR